MPGSARHKIEPPNIPFRSLVRDKRTGRMGVLIAFGARAARVQYAKGIENQFWIKLRWLEQVPPEEIAELQRRAALEVQKQKEIDDLV